MVHQTVHQVVRGAEVLPSLVLVEVETLEDIHHLKVMVVQVNKETTIRVVVVVLGHQHLVALVVHQHQVALQVVP
jgi:hypothetical protein